MQQLRVPDIGDYRNISVIDVLIRAGDTIDVEQSLITLESDKATMDVPSTFAGTIREVLLKPGDVVSMGSVIAHIEFADAASGASGDANESTNAAPAAPQSEPGKASALRDRAASEPQAAAAPAAPITPVEVPTIAAGSASASRVTIAAGPSVRKLARELGVVLTDVKPGDRNARVLREDVLAHVKATLASSASAVAAAVASSDGLDLLPWPEVDFARFGPVERNPLSRIKRISGGNLHRNWVRIPHVTNFDQADITDLEALRVTLNREAREGSAKVTVLAFLIKACVSALQRFAQFNVSLDGQDLVQKHYFHIGFAADTPNGLVVPVIRDADRKGVAAIAEEMAELAKTARAGKLAAAQMQGGCMSISSLGGIGGTHFTPIINAPEVAILGVGKAETRPVWNGSAFEPRLVLPLSLSWDHRAVDGAEAGRFLAYLAALMTDFRRAML
ncbi:2-oxo acid dehydrogenase subunit E2 (plasmid) [Paraburkholderia sp. D15]|uniref:2-oxo acid dehydrogenase subunit E2 n=1 Tax=Paraburkholderia sp. D15 TaxID=2880218 RepID=UPI0024794B2D|nr:2-oxo acid dehydrogenase subunit E2 [Paraburkholderia sp. D15]WGS55133.1 2-oxo acid dehydrogenase subunit E2 [Paraburkholderia sp. D15]